MRRHIRITTAALLTATLATSVASCGSGTSDADSSDRSVSTTEASSTTRRSTTTDAPTTTAAPTTTTTTTPSGTESSGSITIPDGAYPGTIDFKLERTADCTIEMINGETIGIPQCMALTLTVRDAPYGMPIEASRVTGDSIDFGDGAYGLRLAVPDVDPVNADQISRATWWPGGSTGSGYGLEDGGKKTLQARESFELTSESMDAPDGNNYQFVLGGQPWPIDVASFDPAMNGAVVIVERPVVTDEGRSYGETAEAALTFEGDGGDRLAERIQAWLDQPDGG